MPPLAIWLCKMMVIWLFTVLKAEICGRVIRGEPSVPLFNFRTMELSKSTSIKLVVRCQLEGMSIGLLVLVLRARDDFLELLAQMFDWGSQLRLMLPR